MTRARVVFKFLPTAILFVLATGMISAAWMWNRDVEARRGMFAAVEQNAQAIDRKAGIPSESHLSATAMAQALKASDNAEAAHAQVLQSAGILVLLVAAFNAVVVWRLRRGDEPSNTTPHADARDVPASASAAGARAGGRER